MKFADSLAKGRIMLSNLYSNTQVMTGEVVAGIGSSAAIPVSYTHLDVYKRQPFLLELLFPARFSPVATSVSASKLSQ